MIVSLLDAIELILTEFVLGFKLFVINWIQYLKNCTKFTKRKQKSKTIIIDFSIQQFNTQCWGG